MRWAALFFVCGGKSKHHHNAIHSCTLPALTTPRGDKPFVGAAPRSDIIHNTDTHIQQPGKGLRHGTHREHDSDKAEADDKTADRNHQR